MTIYDIGRHQFMQFTTLTLDLGVNRALSTQTTRVLSINYAVYIISSQKQVNDAIIYSNSLYVKRLTEDGQCTRSDFRPSPNVAGRVHSQCRIVSARLLVTIENITCALVYLQNELFFDPTYLLISSFCLFQKVKKRNQLLSQGTL